MIVAYITAYKHRFGVEPICRVLRGQDIQIAPSTYYAAISRPPSTRAVADALLLPVVKGVHAVNYSCYGVRKMWHALRRLGHDVGRDQVLRLMRVAGVKGRTRVKRVITTKRKAGAARFPDLVRREWDRCAPDVVWIADFTHVRTSDGTVYVSLLQDGGTRHLLGFTVSSSQSADLVLKAVEQAVSVRRRFDSSFDSEGVIHHSDAGSQYTSLAFGQKLLEHGIAGSIGRIGTAHDNAMMESTIGLYKTELIHADGRVWASRQEVETATAAWVAWFNNQRLHSQLDYQTPIEFEEEYYRNQAQLKRAA